MAINNALAKKGIRQPHARKDSSDTDALVIINARLAKMTPTGAPACAKDRSSYSNHGISWQ